VSAFPVSFAAGLANKTLKKVLDGIGFLVSSAARSFNFVFIENGKQEHLFVKERRNMQEFKAFKHDEITFPRNFIKDNDRKNQLIKPEITLF
jgi:hypothetical protein